MSIRPNKHVETWDISMVRETTYQALSGILQYWRKTWKEASFDLAAKNDFRHSWVSWPLARLVQGAPIEEVSLRFRWNRHKNRKTETQNKTRKKNSGTGTQHFRSLHIPAAPALDQGRPPLVMKSHHTRRKGELFVNWLRWKDKLNNFKDHNWSPKVPGLF